MGGGGSAPRPRSSSAPRYINAATAASLIVDGAPPQGCGPNQAYLDARATYDADALFVPLHKPHVTRVVCWRRAFCEDHGGASSGLLLWRIDAAAGAAPAAATAARAARPVPAWRAAVLDAISANASRVDAARLATDAASTPAPPSQTTTTTAASADGGDAAAVVRPSVDTRFRVLVPVRSRPPPCDRRSSAAGGAGTGADDNRGDDDEGEDDDEDAGGGVPLEDWLTARDHDDDDDGGDRDDRDLGSSSSDCGGDDGSGVEGERGSGSGRNRRRGSQPRRRTHALLGARVRLDEWQAGRPVAGEVVGFLPYGANGGGGGGGAPSLFHCVDEDGVECDLYEVAPSLQSPVGRPVACFELLK